MRTGGAQRGEQAHVVESDASSYQEDCLPPILAKVGSHEVAFSHEPPRQVVA